MKRIAISFIVLVSLALAGCGGPTPQPPTPTPKPTATPEPTKEAPVKETPVKEEEAPEGMIHIPAGEFIMGSDLGDDDEKPIHKVTLDAYEIDRFEVTNAQFAAFAEATGYQTEAEKTGKSETWRTYAGGKDDHPVVEVTWNDAEAYCRWAGKRLPTEAEWEKAARGADGREYPWGNEWEEGKANTFEAGVGDTEPVGSYPEGASPYGVMDMAGNVWEWVADWYEYDYYEKCSDRNPQGPETGFYKILRGGSWYYDNSYARSAARLRFDPVSSDSSWGFRCARSAQ